MEVYRVRNENPPLTSLLCPSFASPLLPAPRNHCQQLDLHLSNYFLVHLTVYIPYIRN